MMVAFDKAANLKEASRCIIEGDDEKSRSLSREALDNGVFAKEFLDDGLIPGMDVVGVKFRDGDMFLPEVLLAARAMKSAMNVLRPELSKSAAEARGKVLIGTVEGDVHDIGKNIVISMLEGSGFEVIDLGTSVSTATFVSQIKVHKPQVLCMSALLTTTMPAMKVVIAQLEENHLRDKVKVIIGGAPVSETFAREINSDAYAQDATATVALCKQLLCRLA